MKQFSKNQQINKSVKHPPPFPQFKQEKTGSDKFYHQSNTGLGHKIMKSIQSKERLPDCLKIGDMESFLKTIDQQARILFDKIHKSIQYQMSQSRQARAQFMKQQENLHQLNQRIKDEQLRYSDLKKQSVDMQNRVEQLNKRHSDFYRLQKAQNEHRLKIYQLSTALDEQIAVSNRYKGKVRGLQNELQMQRIDIQMEKERLLDLELKLKQEQSRRSETKIQQQNQLKNKLLYLNLRVEQLTQLTSEKSVQISRLDQQLRKSSNSTLQLMAIASHEEMLKSMSQQLEAKQKQLDDLKTKVQRNSLEMNKKLKYTKQTYELKIKQLQDQLSNYQQVQTQKFTRSLSELTVASCFSHESVCINNDEVVENLREQLNQLKSTIQKNSIVANKSFKQQKQKLQFQLQSSFISNESLQDELKRANRKIEQLEKQLGQFRVSKI